MIKTFLFVCWAVVSTVVGALAGALLLLVLYPGPKGPRVTDQQFMTSLVVGAIIGLAWPLAWCFRHWLRRRGKPPPE